MPRVPLPSVNPQVASRGQFAAPAITPVNDQTGRQIQQAGAAVQQLGEGVFNIGAHLQTQFDIARAKEADNLAADTIRTELGAYLQTQGKSATGDARKRAFDSMRSKLSALDKSLGSAGQKTLFQRSVSSRMQEAAFRADEHLAKQTMVYNLAETTTQANSELSDAVDNYGNADFDVHKGNMERAIDDVADQKGWAKDSEQRKALHKDAATSLHSLVVDRLVTEGNMTEAAKYLEAHGAEIEPGRRADLQKVVKKATVADRAQRLQREFAAQGMSALDGLNAANVMFDEKKLTVEERDETVRRVAYEADLSYTLQAREANQVLEEAKAQVLGGQALTPQQSDRLVKLGVFDQFTTWSRAGGQHKTSDFGLFTMQKLQEDPSGFSSYNSWDEVYHTLRGELDDTRLDTVASMWRRFKGIDTTEDALKLDLDLQITRALKDMRLVDEVVAGTRMKPDQRARIDRFTAEVVDDVNLHVKNRKAGAADVEAAIQRLKKNSLKVSGVETPLVFVPAESLQTGVWSTQFGDVEASKLTPEVRKNVHDSLTASGRREEDIYEIDIATEFARTLGDLNQQTQDKKAAELATGEKRLRAFYRGRINKILQDTIVDRQAWAEMEYQAGANVPAEYPTGVPTAQSLHYDTSEEIIRQFGDQMAHFGLSITDMRRILDNEAGIVKPTKITEPKFDPAILNQFNRR